MNEPEVHTSEMSAFAGLKGYNSGDHISEMTAFADVKGFNSEVHISE